MPATTDPSADPGTHLSHVYDNRGRLETRVRMLQSGYRYSQEPASLMRRLISNVEAARAENGELRMSRKTVVLVNAAEPLPNLSFLI